MRIQSMVSWMRPSLAVQLWAGLLSQLLLFERLNQKDGRFKACIGYAVRSRAAWATSWELVSKKKKKVGSGLPVQLGGRLLGQCE